MVDGRALQKLHRKLPKNPCTLCSAVAYCCGAVAPRAIAALLGRFLPRLGPLVHSSGPFFFWELSIPRHSGAHEARGSEFIRAIVVTDSGPAPQVGKCRPKAHPGMTERRESCCGYSAAAWNGPSSPSGTSASALASAAKSAT